jgi:hypothetical protein
MYRIQRQNTYGQINQSGQSSNQNDFNFGVDQLKQQLINYIYGTVNLSQFKYELLQFETELPQLIEKKFCVSANFSGSNCLLVFTKIRDKYHSFLVDRKTLSYNSQKVNLKNVKILNIHVKLDLEIYQGSIFDGTYIQGKNDKTFVITDIYTFKGQDFSKSQLNSKLLTLHTYLKYNYNQDSKDNDLCIMVNKLYQLNETEHLVNNVIPKIKEFSVRGICFYPEISGTKLIFLFGNESRKEPIDSAPAFNLNKPNYSDSYRIKHTDRSSSSPVEKDIELKSDDLIIMPPTNIVKNVKTIYIPQKGKIDENYVFEMKKTDNVDVYYLNVVEHVKDGTITRLKRTKIGIAFIPDISRSKWCRETVESSNDKVLVHCKYYPDKQKWEPVLISSAKRPSSIDEFDLKYLDD